MQDKSRRTFVKTTLIAGAGIISGFGFKNSWAIPVAERYSELQLLSKKLLSEWLNSLLPLQVTDVSQGSSKYGGIICPTKKIIHGRVGDAIYPMLHQANSTGESKFLDSAKLLYHWTEQNVSQPDGSWLNEPIKGSWKGTTIFTAIALAESIKKHGDLIDAKWKNQIENRLLKAGNYVYDVFSIDYGNINYPINAAYGLSLLGEILDIEKFREKGDLFAQQALNAVTPEGFIAGEGALYNQKSKKGCYAVDLGYNVEESLPALVQYALLVKNEEFLEKLVGVLQTHMQFILPDGAWDNSWGTRNYKWTYWGSRTSDGCQPAYALMADRDERFYRVALKNTELLERCTHNGLLYGGPHYVSAGIGPSVHHTFCHAKALATILDAQIPVIKTDLNKLELPREERDNVSVFKDINTVLVAQGGFKSTITGYDQNYKNTKSGHASGGALTMLWHEKIGAIFTASMNEYQLFEADNMQTNSLPSMCLTPRIECWSEGLQYSNLNDFNAEITIDPNHKARIKVKTTLVDKDQNRPKAGEISCEITYIIEPDRVELHYMVSGHQQPTVNFIFSLISDSTEELIEKDDFLLINKPDGKLKINFDKPVNIGERLFNFVPGMQAVPLIFSNKELTVKIEVL
ncbi:MAG TPA: hypothetical protein VL125_02860 [Pelobium sp.]|nr:hypothetical protein [Pelobium sp.]